jgi:hypothetical protein
LSNTCSQFTRSCSDEATQLMFTLNPLFRVSDSVAQVQFRTYRTTPLSRICMGSGWCALT